MQDYETLRQRHLADFAPIMFELVQRLAWSRAQIDAERTAGLRRTVGVARDKSAWFRARLDGVDVERLTLADLRDLPTMTKDDLMSSWDDIVTDPRVTLALADEHVASRDDDGYLLDRYHVVASGGSSGRRGVFLWDWDGWATAYAGIARWPFRYAQATAPAGALTAGVNVASIAADGGAHMTSAMSRTFSNPMMQVHRFSVMKPLREIVAGLNELQPASLLGYASMLFELAHEAKAGRLRIAPRTVGPNGEPLLPEMRKAMEEAWSVPVGGTWGTSEACCTGQSCLFAGGMHLAEDLMIVEPVDAHGQPVEPGQLSAKILLTNLMNPVLPLIRYEITDQVRVLPEACPCGAAFARVDDVHGRDEDVFRYPGGACVHPLVFDSPIGRCPEVIDYQVVQTAGGATIKLLCQGALDAEALHASVVRNLVGAGLRSPLVTLHAVDAIERTAAGKLKRFVALRREPSPTAA